MVKLPLEQAQSEPLQFSLSSRIHFEYTDKYRFNLSTQNYEEINLAFQRLCIAPPVGLLPFLATDIPPKIVLENLLGIYIQAFHPTLPFVHVPSLEKSGTHWLLCLSMMAVGSHYLENEDAQIFVISMHEFVRRALVFGVSNLSWVFRLNYV